MVLGRPMDVDHACPTTHGGDLLDHWYLFFHAGLVDAEGTLLGHVGRITAVDTGLARQLLEGNRQSLV